MKKLVVFVMLFLVALVGVTEASTVNVELNTAELQAVADSLANASLRATDVLEENMDVITEIVDENIVVVIERLKKLSDKFGGKLVTAEQLKTLASTAWVATQQLTEMYIFIVVVKQIAGFILVALLLTFGIICLVKNIPKSKWDCGDYADKEDIFNLSAMWVILSAILTFITGIFTLVYFVPTMLAIFAPKAFALMEVLRLVGINI